MSSATEQSLRLLTVIPRIHRMKVMAGSLMGALPNVGMLLVALAHALRFALQIAWLCRGQRSTG